MSGADSICSMSGTSDICGSPTTESVLLEWAAGAGERLDDLDARVTALHDTVYSVGVALAFAWFSRCWCPSPKLHKPYKH